MFYDQFSLILVVKFFQNSLFVPMLNMALPLLMCCADRRGVTAQIPNLSFYNEPNNYSYRKGLGIKLDSFCQYYTEAVSTVFRPFSHHVFAQIARQYLLNPPFPPPHPHPHPLSLPANQPNTLGEHWVNIFNPQFEKSVGNYIFI
jgi:hypothetical protein